MAGRLFAARSRSSERLLRRLEVSGLLPVLAQPLLQAVGETSWYGPVDLQAENRITERLPGKRLRLSVLFLGAQTLLSVVQTHHAVCTAPLQGPRASDRALPTAHSPPGTILGASLCGRCPALRRPPSASEIVRAVSVRRPRPSASTTVSSRPATETAAASRHARMSIGTRSQDVVAHSNSPTHFELNIDELTVAHLGQGVQPYGSAETATAARYARVRSSV